MLNGCQDNGVLPIIIDTENALDETWMRNFGIDPEGYIMKISAAMLDDIAKIMSDFISNYKDSYGSMEYDERPKYCSLWILWYGYHPN